MNGLTEQDYAEAFGVELPDEGGAADGGSETAYVCRNPQCARYDRRLRKKKDAPAADGAAEA